VGESRVRRRKRMAQHEYFGEPILEETGGIQSVRGPKALADVNKAVLC
jgi:hypothetical protein